MLFVLSRYVYIWGQLPVKLSIIKQFNLLYAAHTITHISVISTTWVCTRNPVKGFAPVWSCARSLGKQATCHILGLGNSGNRLHLMLRPQRLCVAWGTSGQKCCRNHRAICSALIQSTYYWPTGRPIGQPYRVMDSLNRLYHQYWIAYFNYFNYNYHQLLFR
jgi:hypothetical protein